MCVEQVKYGGRDGADFMRKTYDNLMEYCNKTITKCKQIRGEMCRRITAHTGEVQREWTRTFWDETQLQQTRRKYH